ncbi:MULTISPECIES: hypothetical protein [Arthrobacter]|uniref:Uncharacterized protein n=1 Tax=Arthrobacter psychrochitiniphilus TaxID=291045 RepID=A0A2V3DSN1_9MICC|nr:MULTISPECIES: hypothetical protein [Arthrobacter]NYG18876.1 hypothetical protein [Arthrobacter psychrochitiniphilus]PXA66218.1 hypothetical protein CVS29_05810 [Arthrobacter psychrochitiniphilus]
MSKGTKKALGILSGLTLLGLNIAVSLFFALWQIADGAAINRMETTNGFDPSQMLPNADLMWMASHASLLMVLVADVLAAVFVVILVKSRQRSRQALVEPLCEPSLRH